LCYGAFIAFWVLNQMIGQERPVHKIASDAVSKAKVLPEPSAFKPQFILGQDLKNELGLNRCPEIKSAADIAATFESIAHLEREVMVAGALDCQCKLIFCNLLSVGTSDRLAMRVGDVFFGVIRAVGSAVFLAHNHPSGCLTPSSADLDLTRDVAEAGLLLGYPLLDHVIITRRGYTSLLAPSALKGRESSSKITRAYTRQASDGNASLCTWRCTACGAVNPGMGLMNQVTVGKNICVPAKCTQCRTFTWLSTRINTRAKQRAK